MTDEDGRRSGELRRLYDKHRDFVDARIAEAESDELYDPDLPPTEDYSTWRKYGCVDPAELARLRAQVAAVRALAEAVAATPPPAPRWLGWGVDRPDGSSSFGTFREFESAQRCADSVRRGLCPDAVIVEHYVHDEADTRIAARDVLAALDGPEANL